MTASLGGFTIDRLYGSGLNALVCEVSSPHADKVFQLYVGRQLAGVTSAEGRYTITAQLAPTICPAPITIVMCDLTDRDTDFGALLPRRPWNRYRIHWNAATFDSDARWYSIHGSPAADESIDYDTTLVRTEFAGDGNYSQELPDFTGCGLWSVGIVPRDDAIPNGNAGTPAEYSIDAVVYPPDVFINEDDTRLAVSVDAGELTVAFEYDWPT